MTETSPLQGRAQIYTVAQVVISSLGFLTSILGGFVLLLIAITSFASDTQALQQSSALLVLAWTSLFVGFLFLPGLYTGIQRIRRKHLPTIPPNLGHRLLFAGLVVWLISLFITFVGSNWSWVGVLNSIFVLPLVILPLIFLVVFGARKLSLGSPVRTWGAISFNFFVTMPVALTAEMIIFAIIIFIIIIWLTGNPELLRQVMAYSQQLTQAQMDPAVAEKIVSELFKQPLVLNGSLLVIALIVPMLEELLKPMALWFLAGKKLTPSQGFVGGLIGGACFATLETLGAIGAPTDISWFGLLLGRMGTGLLHVTLSGLVGWGLASAFYNGNWKRFLGNYLAAAFLHGTWNLFALLSGIIPLLPFSDEIGSLPVFLSKIGPAMLTLIAVVNLIILLSTNRKFQQQAGLPDSLPQSAG